MRKSFGGGSRGMGGGNGGGMLKRAVRTTSVGGGAAQESFSHSTTTTAPANTSTTTSHVLKNKASACLSLSSTPSSSAWMNNLIPISAATTWDSSSSESDWECLDGSYEADERVINNIFFDDYNNILGPIPSTDEVHHALSALHQVLQPSYFSHSTKNCLGNNTNEDTDDQTTGSINPTREVSSCGAVCDWIEPSIHICNSNLLQSHGSNRVYDAFHLLQTEPSIQKMVISLSSDKAVWDAVLNNEAVREIRDSLKQADNVDLAGSCMEGSEKSDDTSDGTTDILSWIIVNTKEKVMEMVEKIIEFVNEWFQPLEPEMTSEESSDPFAESLRTSFFLSVVVLLIVVVARAQHA